MENKGISQDELKAIENEVARKQADALKQASEIQAKEIEDKVRKEMEVKQEAERLKEQLRKQEEETAKRIAELESKSKSQQDVFEKRLAELEAQRKGVVASTQSPFTSTPNPNIKNVNGQEVDISNLNHTEIERQSAEAFRRHFNLPNFFFEKTGEIKR